MPIDKQTTVNLEQVLGGLADVLGVGLVITDSQGSALTKWQYPGDKGKPSSEPKIVGIDTLKYREWGVAVKKNVEGRRRFVVKVPEIGGGAIFIQSAYLPRHYAWVDGRLAWQKGFKGGYWSAEDASFMLGVFISNVCCVSINERDNLPAINDLDIENIRRIGISLREKIECKKDEHKPGKFSLEGVPSIDALFSPYASDLEPPRQPKELTEMFEAITAGAKGSFNLMSLSGDFLLEGTRHNPLCRKVIRKYFGDVCFASDIKCLIKATLADKNKEKIPFKEKCPAGFTELFYPVFTDGLIVGLVFGGRLVRSEEDAKVILNYIGKKKALIKEKYSQPKPDGKGEIERTGRIVWGLSVLIELIFERYCIAEKWAMMEQELAGLPVEKHKDIFQRVCYLVKRLMVAHDCSIFMLEDDHLVLSGTTANEFGVCEKSGEPWKTIKAENAIGNVYYEAGEGITGSVVITCEPRFERKAAEADGWEGKLNEDDGRSQIYVVPIMWLNKCYGVLRAIRPASFGEFPATHRFLILRFAGELGIVLHNVEMTNAEAVHMKQIEELQSHLAEAAHECRSPLHNILSLSIGLRYTSDEEKIKDLHEKIKSEVYRARRVLGNYLMRGVEGREELKYNLKSNDLGGLVVECASRFRSVAYSKDVKIRIGYKVREIGLVVFDYDRIDQVFSNLIDNAVKYSFDKTEILISAKDKTNTVTVSIKDMGLGIPKEAQNQIFEGYQRTVEDCRRFKPGMGLGLKIALQIVKAHGGDIFVESEPVWDDPKRLALMEGYETKFTVSLPKKGPSKKV